MTAQPFWTQQPSDLAQTLDCGMEGLSSNEIASRQQRFGRNLDRAVIEAGTLRLVLARLLEPMSLVLAAASAISAVTGDGASAIIILLILSASILLDILQEGRAKQAARALQSSVAVKARVIRDGALRQISAEEIVPGDVIELDVGDVVPADALLLESKALTIDEAALTGEPYGVVKSPQTTSTLLPAEASNALFRGSVVMTGEGRALVAATGAQTLFGKAAEALGAAADRSPFEEDLRQLGLLIARAAAVLVLVVLAANIGFGRPLVDSLMFSVALAVGLTPELLPMITTVTLSRGAIRMAKRKVIVKRLSAIHDLGAMTIFCTDKTGTLTSAEIVLQGSLNARGQADERAATYGAIAALLGGDKSSLDLALTAARPQAAEGWTERGRYPFDYQRRMGAVLAENADGLTLIVKGAPEAILNACATIDGKPADAAARAQVLALVKTLASDGLRAIAVASRPFAETPRDPVAEDEQDLDFCGLCSFADPPKPSAGPALARLAAAGVRTVILSGDDPIVVGRLGAAVGLQTRKVMTGADLAELSPEALAVQVRDVNLFARLAPEQKVRVVRALKASGAVVGFMGDGVNDAPAIRIADVGLSVDTATGVAREAADMILLDSDLSVVADGIEEGRQTFANILKYVRMGASSNFGNMLSMAAAAFFLPFLPMLATQILLNNLLYDFSEIGIPFDRVAKDTIAKPQRWVMSDLVRFAAIMGPLSSVFDIATFATLHLGFHLSPEAFRTGWFVESIATQVLVIFLIRTPQRPWKDRPDSVLTTSTLIALVVAILLPLSPLATALGFASLPGNAWLSILAIVAVYLVMAELLKRSTIRA